MSIKCPRCDLMNFAGTEGCRRCQTPFMSMPPPMPSPNYPPVNNYPPANNYPPVNNYPPAPYANYGPASGAYNDGAYNGAPYNSPPYNGAYNNAYPPYPPYPYPPVAGGYNYQKPKEYKGIGGWLILPALGLVFTPLIFGSNILQGIQGLLDIESIARSTMSIPTNGMRTAIVLEILGNCLLMLFGMIVAVLFFKKSKLVPTLYMIFLFANLFYAVFDYFLAHSSIDTFMSAVIAETGNAGILKEARSIKLESVQLIFRTMGSCAIWIPYFKISKRVKATFIN